MFHRSGLVSRSGGDLPRAESCRGLAVQRPAGSVCFCCLSLSLSLSLSHTTTRDGCSYDCDLKILEAANYSRSAVRCSSLFPGGLSQCRGLERTPERALPSFEVLLKTGRCWASGPSLGMFLPFTNRDYNRGGTVMISIKECWYKGEHPNPNPNPPKSSAGRALGDGSAACFKLSHNPKPCKPYALALTSPSQVSKEKPHFKPPRPLSPLPETLHPIP